MTSEGELYVDETCRDKFEDKLDKVFGKNKWKLEGSNHSDYNLTTIPANISVAVMDENNEDYIGRADIVSKFELEEDVMTGIRYGVAVPFEIQIHKIKPNEKVCMQCSGMKMHAQTLHNENGCCVYGCGCRVVNVPK